MEEGSLDDQPSARVVADIDPVSKAGKFISLCQSPYSLTNFAVEDRASGNSARLKIAITYPLPSVGKATKLKFS